MNDTADCSLWWTPKGFSVQQLGCETCYIDRSDLDTTLQNISAINILQYLNAGKFALSKASDGSYILRSYIPGHGGGFALFHWIAKGLFSVGTYLATGGSSVINAITVGQAIHNVSQVVQPHIPEMTQRLVNTVEQGALQMGRYMGYEAAQSAPGLGNLLHAGITGYVTDHMGTALNHGASYGTSLIAEGIAATWPNGARDIAVTNASNPQLLFMLGQFLNFASIVVRF